MRSAPSTCSVSPSNKGAVLGKDTAAGGRSPCEHAAVCTCCKTQRWMTGAAKPTHLGTKSTSQQACRSSPARASIHHEALTLRRSFSRHLIVHVLELSAGFDRGLGKLISPSFVRLAMPAVRMGTLELSRLGCRREPDTNPTRAVLVILHSTVCCICAPDLSSGYRPCVSPVAESNGSDRE